jgi:hypothetical protein
MSTSRPMGFDDCSVGSWLLPFTLRSLPSPTILYYITSPLLLPRVAFLANCSSCATSTSRRMGFDNCSVGSWLLPFPFRSLPSPTILYTAHFSSAPLSCIFSRIAPLVPCVRVTQWDLTIVAMLGSWLLPFPFRSLPSPTIPYYITSPLLLP